MNAFAFARLDEVTRRLRRECPWDKEQTHASLARHAIEECYELVEAIEEWSPEADAAEDHLIEELGDVLIQVFVHTAIAQQAGRFDANEVARRAADKLVARHPHVYGDVEAKTVADVMSNWETNKKLEKARASVLDGIPSSLPALLTASKYLRKANNIGIEVELGDAQTIGDELFAIVRKAVDAGLEPEDELRKTLKRYREEFTIAEATSLRRD